MPHTGMVRVMVMLFRSGSELILALNDLTTAIHAGFQHRLVKSVHRGPGACCGGIWRFYSLELPWSLLTNMSSFIGPVRPVHSLLNPCLPCRVTGKQVERVTAKSKLLSSGKAAIQPASAGCAPVSRVVVTKFFRRIKSGDERDSYSASGLWSFRIASLANGRCVFSSSACFLPSSSA